MLNYEIYFPIFSEVHIQFREYFHIMVSCSVGSHYYKKVGCSTFQQKYFSNAA